MRKPTREASRGLESVAPDALEIEEIISSLDEPAEADQTSFPVESHQRPVRRSRTLRTLVARGYRRGSALEGSRWVLRTGAQ